MKKLVFTAIAVIAFSGIGMANTKEVVKVEDKSNDPCAAYASCVMQKVEAQIGCIEDASEYNALYNYYYSKCLSC